MTNIISNELKIKEMTTEEQVSLIFTKVKNLEPNKKMQIRRAEGRSFDELNAYQKIIIKNILKDTNWCYSGLLRDFIIDMCAIYIKQNCENGIAFEECLKKIYDNGSPATQKKSGYLVDEEDKAVLIRYIKKYVKMCSKNSKISILNLTTDIIQWPYYQVRDRWIDTIAGIKNSEEKGEK